MRDSLLPLEGDTVQLLTVGAAASLLPLPLLQPPRPQARSPRELPGPARPAAPSPPKHSLLPQGKERPGGAAAGPPGIRANLLLSVATCACAETSHPPPRRSEGERNGGKGGRGELRCAALCRGGGRETAQAQCARAAGEVASAASGAPLLVQTKRRPWGTCCLVKVLGRRAARSRIHSGEKGVPPASPRGARLELPLLIRPPGASPRPSAVRCVGLRAGWARGGCCC